MGLPVILITGMSGSGKSNVLKIFEDLSYETIDNLPVFLLPAVVSSSPTHPLAIEIDIRSRGFKSSGVLGEIKNIAKTLGIRVEILFIDADNDILERRYKETRRPHPLALDRSILDGIHHERILLAPLKEKADHLIDTSLLTLPDLKTLIRSRYQIAPHKTWISLTSFSYKKGVPREADFVIDVRFLKNPYYTQNLKELSGQDAPVAEDIKKDPLLEDYILGLQNVFSLAIQRSEEEGRAVVNIAIGCTGGQHRSVFMVETLGNWLKKQGKDPKVYHRDMVKA